MVNYRKIRELRQTLFPDKNMKEFCKEAKINPSSLSKIETLNQRPNPETLDKIASGLKVPVEMILWVCVKPSLPEKIGFKYEAYKGMLDNIFIEIMKESING